MDPDGRRQAERLLLETLQADLSKRQRLRAMEELIPVASDRSVPQMRECLSSDQLRVRVAAIHTLATIGTEPAIAALVSTLPEQDRYGVTFTVEALRWRGLLGPAVPALIACLENRGDVLGAGCKLGIIVALRRVANDERTVGALSAMLTDRSRSVRRAAAISLGSIRTAESRKALRDAVQHSSWLKGRPVRRALASFEAAR